MRIVWTRHSWDEYTAWLGVDRRLVTRINRLIDDILRDPDGPGIGKAEFLKHFTGMDGVRSRRIDQATRLVSAFHGDDLVILQCRFVY